MIILPEKVLGSNFGKDLLPGILGKRALTWVL